VNNAAIIQYLMYAAGACYVVAGFLYWQDGKPWFGLTMLSYASAILFLWMASR
jgi:hypothetical protein